MRQCPNLVVLLILENMTNEHVKVASQTVMIAGTFVKTIKCSVIGTELFKK